MQSKEVWAVTVSYFCYGYVAWIFFSWFYRYLAKVRGLDLKASAFYTMLPFLAMLVCCLLGGTTQRPAHKVARAARWTLRTCGIFDCDGRNIHRLRLAGSKCAAGQRRARRWSRCAVFLAEFLLVGDGRHCRGIFGFGVGLHEYGKSDWSGAHRFSHSLDRSPIRLDDLISSGGWVVRGRCGELAGRGSIAATQSFITERWHGAIAKPEMHV